MIRKSLVAGVAALALTLTGTLLPARSAEAADPTGACRRSAQAAAPMTELVRSGAVNLDPSKVPAGPVQMSPTEFRLMYFGLFVFMDGGAICPSMGNFRTIDIPQILAQAMGVHVDQFVPAMAEAERQQKGNGSDPLRDAREACQAVRDRSGEVLEVTKDTARVMTQLDPTLALRNLYFGTMLAGDEAACKMMANPQQVPSTVITVMRSHMQNFVDAYGDYLVERDRVLAARR